MCTRFPKSVCLLLATLVACIACHSPQARGEDPPTQVVQQSEWETRIEAALDAKGEWAFENIPFNQVCASIQEKLGINVAIDLKALEDHGMDSNTPITRALSGVSNRSFLRLLLSDLELTYTVRYGALWITTHDRESGRGLITKVYPVGDLLVRDTATGGPDYEFLSQSIMSAIAPDAWDQVGGPGSIDGIYDSLVIAQTHDIHEEVEQFLTAYRDIVTVEREGEQPQPTVVMLGKDTAAAIQAALDEPYSAEFKDSPLSEVLEVISKATEIPIVIDTRALEDFGIDTSTPINGKFAETALRFVLFRILNEQELTFTIRDEVLLITTPEVCEGQLAIRLYPVRDLVQLANAPLIDRPGADCDVDSLIQAVTATIAPDTWDTVGGPGAIEFLLPAPALMIAQTHEIHEEISELFVKLRAAKKLAAARTSGVETVDPAALIVRSYPLYVAFHSPDEIVKLIMRASEPGTWDDGSGSFVQGLGMSIVVKHNADGHREVQKLLSQLGIWSPQAGRGRKGFGGGGVAVPAAGAPPVGGGVSPGGFF